MAAHAERLKVMRTTTTRVRLRAATVGILAVVLLTVTPGSASAERLGLDDGPDVGDASLSDIYAVSAVHGKRKVVVRVDFADLVPTSEAGPSSVSIFIDTDRSAKGPEFRIASGLQKGTDYQLTRMEGWKAVGGPLTCPHAVSLNFVKERAKAQVDRSCLGNPAKVRIGVKMTDHYDPSHPVVDWLGKRRYLSMAIASG